MPLSALQVECQAQGTTHVVVATGELDVGSVQRVRQAVDGVLSGCPETVVLDLSALAFCDSSAIRLTSDAHRRASAQGVRFVGGAVTP